MRIFDPHAHMTSRTTDDYQAMYESGVRVLVEPAFWLGQPRTSVGSFVDYFNSLLGWERFRSAQFGIRHHCTIGLNPNPVSDAITYAYGEEVSDETWYEDHTTPNPKMAMTTAFEPFPELPTRQTSSTIISFERNVAHTATYSTFKALRNRINNASTIPTTFWPMIAETSVNTTVSQTELMNAGSENARVKLAKPMNWVPTWPVRAMLVKAA